MTEYTCCYCIQFQECGCGIGDTEPHGDCEIMGCSVDADEEPCDGFILDGGL